MTSTDTFTGRNFGWLPEERRLAIARLARIIREDDFYSETSDLQRAGRLRNGDQELQGIRLTDQDVGPLAAFLKSLNEDYE